MDVNKHWYITYMKIKIMDQLFYIPLYIKKSLKIPKG